MPSVESFFDQCNALTSGKSSLQILRETRAFLSDESRWTKRALARDQEGYPVRPEDPTAVAWCLEGAVSLACNPFGIVPPSMLKLLDKVVSIIFLTEEDITACMYNELADEHSDILYLLDEAILIEEVKLGLEQSG